MPPATFRFACALALVAGACGRIGFDPRSDNATDGGPGAGIDASFGAIGDAAVQLGDGGACMPVQSSECSSWTVSIPAGGGDNSLSTYLQVYADPLTPTCGAAGGFEFRLAYVAPVDPVLVLFSVDAQQDLVLSFHRDDCDGDVESCSTSNGGGSSVGLGMDDGERILLSIVGSDPCEEITVMMSAGPISSVH